MKTKTFLALAFAAFATMVNQAHAVFISGSGGGLYHHNVSTNSTTFVGNMRVAMFDIALNPVTNTLYGMSGTGNLYSINTTNAATSLIGNRIVKDNINGLTFDSLGTLFGSGQRTLYTIDTGTGAASAVGSTGALGFNSSGDIAFDSSGNLFLSALGRRGSNQLVSVNTLTGIGSAIGNIGYSGVYGLNFSGSTLYGYTVGGNTIGINTGTGVGSNLAYNGITAFGASGVGGVSVPEPSTLALLSLGFIGVGAARKLKKH